MYIVAAGVNQYAALLYTVGSNNVLGVEYKKTILGIDAKLFF